MRRNSWPLFVILICLGGGIAFGQPNFAPMHASVHPVIDGAVTFPLPASLAAPHGAEWSIANNIVNLQNDGTFRAEWQANWVATSSTDNQAMYPGVTLFDMHDLWGYTTQELADYNTFEYRLGQTTLKAWVFANADEPNDATWIGNSGLGYANVVDEGFIVRLNNNPATDIHWLPGMPEPGDAAWVWNTYYGFFGSAGFNDSAFQAGLPLSVNGAANEVYEVALYGQALPWIQVSGGGFTPCVTTVIRTVSDPKNGNPSLTIEIKVDGPGHVNVIPEPAGIVLLGLGGFAVLPRRVR